MGSVKPTVHGTAVLIGERALLIRGASGSGKSFLAHQLIRQASLLPSFCARLVADDRVRIEAIHGTLFASAPQDLAGLIELRYQGLQILPFEACALVGAVLDLDDNAPRLPGDEETFCNIDGVTLPRFSRPAKPMISMAEALFMTGGFRGRGD